MDARWTPNPIATARRTPNPISNAGTPERRSRGHVFTSFFAYRAGGLCVSQWEGEWAPMGDAPRTYGCPGLPWIALEIALDTELGSSIPGAPQGTDGR